MKRFADWFISEESGQGMVEYGLIIALVAVVLIVALVSMNEGLSGIFERITGALSDPEGAGGTTGP